MSIGYILAWLVAFSSGTMIFQYLRHRPHGNRGWLMIHVLILAAIAIMFCQNRDLAGFVGAELWILLVIAPSLILRRTQNLVHRGRYRKARYLARLGACLHPADGWRSYPELIRGLELDSLGKTAEAEAVFRRYDRFENTLTRQVIAERCALNGDWEGLVKRIRSSGEILDTAREPTMFIYYLRALGETGDLNELVTTAARAQTSADMLFFPTQARLFVYAFCGLTRDVAALFLGPLKHFPLEVQEFWIATSEMAAENSEGARRRLTDLLGHTGAAQQRSIQRRLHHGLARAITVLTKESQDALSRIVQDQHSSRPPNQLPGIPSNRAYVTYFLIAINVFIFALEAWFGGTTNLDTLYQMGALVVEPGGSPDAWRLVASTFLHYGPVHIGMNMLALYVLGPFVENALGRVRFLICYLASGILSMALVCFLSRFLHEQILVGASGSIMGMVGATAAILIRLWKTHRSQGAMRRLKSTLSIIVFQFIFDLSTKEVSMTAHLGGVFFGFLIALTMEPNRSDP